MGRRYSQLEKAVLLAEHYQNLYQAIYQMISDPMFVRDGWLARFVGEKMWEGYSAEEIGQIMNLTRNDVIHLENHPLALAIYCKCEAEVIRLFGGNYAQKSG